MGKNKPRKYPDKPQNKYGYWCQCCEIIDGKMHCEHNVPSHVVEKICKGNPHNCCKVLYKKWAGKDPKKGVPKK